jgi:hypothetical protein
LPGGSAMRSPEEHPLFSYGLMIFGENRGCCHIYL